MAELFCLFLLEDWSSYLFINMEVELTHNATSASGVHHSDWTSVYVTLCSSLCSPSVTRLCYYSTIDDSPYAVPFIPEAQLFLTSVFLEVELLTHQCSVEGRSWDV